MKSPPVPSDPRTLPELSVDIYPLHLLDDLKVNYVFVTWIMRFNDVLDAKKLYESLSKLLETGDWRKLGGRLKFKSDGKLEIHVPKQFTAACPAVGFSHDDHLETSIEDHTIARHLPKPSNTPYAQTIFSDTTDFRCFAARPNFPKTIQEMVDQDAPQLSLHVTSFSDATLVSLAWPHTMMDGLGQLALLKAWSLVLAKKEEEVPQVLGAREDVLNQLDSPDHDGEQTELAIESKRLSGLDFVRFLLQFLWHRLWNPPRETRAVFLPKSAWKELQRQAREDLKGTEGVISEGDLLVAWITRIIASSEPKARPVTLGQALNGRYRLPWLQKAGGVYLQNIVGAAYTFLTPQLAKSSTGEIALENRRQLLEQATEQQVSALFRTNRHDVKARGKIRFLFGEVNALPIILNNLTRPAFMRVTDFSPAVLRQGENADSRKNPSGTMVNYIHLVLGGPIKTFDNFYILDKDHSENYWLMGTVSDRAWVKFDEELMRLRTAT